MCSLYSNFEFKTLRGQELKLPFFPKHFSTSRAIEHFTRGSVCRHCVSAHAICSISRGLGVCVFVNVHEWCLNKILLYWRACKTCITSYITTVCVLMYLYSLFTAEGCDCKGKHATTSFFLFVTCLLQWCVWLKITSGRYLCLNYYFVFVCHQYFPPHMYFSHVTSIFTCPPSCGSFG